MDDAALFHAMDLDYRAACIAAGIPPPTPEEWVDRLDEMIADAQVSR